MRREGCWREKMLEKHWEEFGRSSKDCSEDDVKK